jgi:hypothetical protein
MATDGRGDGDQLGAGQAAALLHLQPPYPPGPSLEAIRYSNFFPSQFPSISQLSYWDDSGSSVLVNLNLLYGVLVVA